MKPADVRKHISAAETAPIYLLEGADHESRLDLAAEFASLVDEGLQAFNVESFYANDATSAGARDQLIGALLAAARTLPMMAPRRVVTVHHAERLLSPRKSQDDEPEPLPPPEKGPKQKRGLTPSEELEQYLESPEPLTTMVLVAGLLDANRRLVKAVRAHAVVVDCGSIGNAAEAGRWVRARLQKDNLAIEPQAVTLLVEATGWHLDRIRAAVDKLVLFAAGEPAVTAQHVREMVLPQADPGEGFALGRAIWKADARAALREIDAQLDNGEPPFRLLGQIRAAAGRLEPYDRARKGLDLVFRTDLAMKSSAGQGRFLIERLVIELCGR